MSGSQDEQRIDVPEADRLDQERELTPEPHDPERTATEPAPDGISANPADVAEQSIEVPADEDDALSE